MDDAWQKQERNQALFPDLEWSRPENKQHAGKLLIIGGNSHGFAAPAEAYQTSIQAGIGVSRVILPSALQKIVGSTLDYGEFTASTPSGSLAQASLGEIVAWSKWSDGLLLAGDMGRNSETAVLVEKLLQKTDQIVVLTKDSVDFVTTAPQVILTRPDTTLVLSLSQLQRLVTAAKYKQAVTLGMDLLHLVTWLKTFTREFTPYIVVKHHDYILVAVNGEVSATKLPADMPLWRLKAASYVAVWWIQNKTKPFEALSTAIYQLI